MLLVFGTLVTSVVTAMEPVHPIAAMLARIAVAAGLGYLAAEPRPTTTGDRRPRRAVHPVDAP